jgi:nucleotide-binding universal stress UspA family protein
MNKVYACIDGWSNTPAVIDAAVWCAGHLGSPVEFLHVLERHFDPGSFTDLSGAIGLDAQDSLLQELGRLDEKRSALAQQAGRLLLANARLRATVAGAADVVGRLRRGEWADSVQAIQAGARLVVFGMHQPGAESSIRHVDARVERVVRAVKCPLLIVPGRTFVTPERIVLAFDGSAASWQIVQSMIRTPELAQLPVILVMAMVEEDDDEAHRQREEAGGQLAAAGFRVETRFDPGAPEDVLPPFVNAHGRTLLIMGAYGHSRLRHLVVGSTTTALLRLSEVPVLVLR